MVSMTIFGLLMISVLDSVANIGIARTKSMTRIILLEELYFFSEKLASSIKDGGIIDYEEYWNRQVVWTGSATWHYLLPTGFWNYWLSGSIGSTQYGSWYYYCRSQDTLMTKVGTGWCLGASVNSSTISHVGWYQRYGQYKLQYTDFNGNNDVDTTFWDEDNNGNIREDEDDKDLGDGPIVLSWSSPELYLYNPTTKERVLFRYSYRPDEVWSPVSCNMTTGVGCVGNIEILRLKGKDLGLSHSWTPWDIGLFDGIIDTWLCHPDWSCNGPTIPPLVWWGRLPTWNDSEWIKMFPDYVDVRKLSFSIYPQKDPWRSWAANDCLSWCPSWFISPFIQPYVRVQMTLWLTWEKRRLIRWDDPTIAISTTISLSHTDLE